MSAGGSDASSRGEVADSGPKSPSGPADASGRPAGSGRARTITDLELAFAQNPDSEVYVELVHAYLEKRRFMEAVVVCKRVVRARPDEVRPKLLLARVHEAQERYPRAMEVLEELEDAHPDDPEVRLALGRVRLATGAEESGVADLKRALDLDRSLEEATRLLEARGIAYPPPPPPPPPEAAPPPAGVASPAGGTRSGSHPAVGPAASGVHPAVAGVHPAVSGVHPAVSGVHPAAAAGAPVEGGAGTSGVYRVRPQLLEGEEELERLAAKVAEEQDQPPRAGRAKTTLVLLAVLMVVSAVVVSLRFLEKRRTEAIRTLSERAVRAFDRDLYASYKTSADALETILSDYDADHRPTLARLSHVYAILVTEHLEEGKRARMMEVLDQAEAQAVADQHTVSARGLVTLHAGEDHLEAAERAVDVLAPEAAADATSVLSFVDLTLGVALLDAGDVDSAHRRLREVAEFMGNNIRAQIWAARAAAAAGRPSTARRYFTKARQREPRHPGAIAGLALVNLARGDLVSAAAALEAFDRLESEGSRDISPKDRALAVFARSELLRRDGQDAAADVAYDQARKLDPDNTDFPYQRGKGLLERDVLKGAIEYLGQAVEMAPTRWTYRIELAEALMLAKRYDEAKTHLDVALDKAPKDLRVALTKARFLRRTDSREAEPFLTEELPRRFPSAKVEIGLELGRFYREKGELDAARAALSEAIQGFSGRPQSLKGEVLVTFGLVAADQGKKFEAIEAYREAARLGSLDALALLAISLQSGNAEEREEAKQAALQYLAAGKNLRRSALMRQVLERL